MRRSVDQWCNRVQRRLAPTRRLALGRGAGHRARRFPRVHKRSIQRRKNLARVAQEDLARDTQLHPARAASEQGRADLFFQCADLPTERGLRNVQPKRRATCCAGFSHGHEIAKLI